VMLAFLVALFTAVSACGGKMHAFLETTPGNLLNCTLSQIDQPQGDVLSSSAFPGCSDRTGASNGSALSAFDYNSYGMFFLTGQGVNVYDVDLNSKQTSIFGTLPTTYSTVVGLSQLNAQGVYVITTSDVLFAPATSHSARTFTSFLQLPLSLSAVSTYSFWVPSLFLFDNGMMKVVNLTDSKNPIVSSMPLALPLGVGLTAMSIYAPTAPIVTAIIGVGSDFNLYWIDAMTYDIKAIMALPHADNKTITYTTIMDNEMFYSDQSNLYDVDILAAEILTANPFQATLLEGDFQIHP